MTDEFDNFPEVRQLLPAQRRVLGVLLEKGKTTPEYYPMTLKGLTAGCNQKNNRDPVVEYSDEHVEDTLESLQKLGLTSPIYPSSGRALKYRHNFRLRYQQFSERQVAIMTELLCRGRQTLGELRTRASRLEPIDDLDTLRAEVKGLMDLGFMRANGPLESRGVEVDHTFYLPHEKIALPEFSPRAMPDTPTTAVNSLATPAVSTEVAKLTEAQDALREEVVALRATVEQLQDRLDKLASDLGVN